MPEELSREIREWQKTRCDKESAVLLGIPLPTFRAYKRGLRIPNKLAYEELKRRMDTTEEN